ncbi:MAG: DUF896 domain-containing protein [Clostridium sp.]|uniref:DUF896 domain-containing protein n=1 Tax=Clostridium sp. TaxID=1506 RepID=UPI003F3C43D9
MENKEYNIDKMTIEEVTEKINELYKKSKEESGLTEEEKDFQQKLRKRYIENVKKNFKAQLSSIKKK